MILKNFKLLFIFSLIQFCTLFLSFFLFMVVLFSSLFIIPPMTEFIDANISGDIFVLFVLSIAAIIYGVIWYRIIKVLKEKELNTFIILIYCMIPNILFTALTFPNMLMSQDPSGCGFIPPRMIFFCFSFSLILFPILWIGSNKWVLNSSDFKTEVIRLIELFIIMGIVGLTIIGILFLIVDNPNLFFIGY